MGNNNRFRLHMETPNNYIVFMIIASAVTFLLLLFVIINLFAHYKNRQLKHLNDVLDLNSKFEKEILEIKNEVTEQVFTDIASELHDDICQTLTLGIYQMNQSEETEGELNKYVSEAKKSLEQGINDLRTLSKRLSRDYWKNYDIETTLVRLSDKITNANRIKTNFSIDPNIKFNSKDQEIIIIRILQELINNSLKYSQASLIELCISEEIGGIKITYMDNGIGFKNDDLSKGDGLGIISITQRLNLLNAKWEIKSDDGFKFDSLIPNIQVYE